MSRQNTRITRWLMGLPESEPESPAPDSRRTPHTLEVAAPPPLPTRAPDTARPRVQGLQGSARDVRRRQLDTDPRHRAAAPVPTELQAISGELATRLEHLAATWDGFHSAVIATEQGAALAHAGLEPHEASALAESTSRMTQGMGLPTEELEVAAVSLASGHIVVVARVERAGAQLLLRLTCQGTAMGLAIVQAQRTAKSITSA